MKGLYIVFYSYAMYKNEALNVLFSPGLKSTTVCQRMLHVVSCDAYFERQKKKNHLFIILMIQHGYIFFFLHLN